jgi:hypothetical protein
VTKTSKNHALILKGKNRELLIEFLRNLLDRKFTDAERVLESLDAKDFSDKEFKKGYINALEGMILSSRSGDDRDFFNKENFHNEKLAFQKEFNSFREKISTSNFDRGYFSAWSDLTQYKFNIKE